MPSKASGFSREPGREAGAAPARKWGAVSFGKKEILRVAGATTEGLQRKLFRVGEALARAVAGRGTFIMAGKLACCALTI